MNILKVKLWGTEIGRLAWNPHTRTTTFIFNLQELNKIPDLAPLIAPVRYRSESLIFPGDDRPIYQGLPPFLADSLPDSWGNALFDKWVKDNKIPRNRITPLYKLMFIGTRGMGALEYEPAAEGLSHNQNINIKALYDTSLMFLEQREEMILDANEDLTLQALLSIGTSAGGRQMKAIIAIHPLSGEIRSGQTLLSGFDYYILKFGDNSLPLGEIEYAYHLLAKDCGIKMEDCRLMKIDGINHFLTKRFDRKNDEKIHVQTLAAINPDANSYEDLLATCRALHLSEGEIEQIFRIMTFNVMANNTDDHNKNFSFLLEENGHWRLAPAYDMTFIFNPLGTGPNLNHRLSIGGMTSGFSKENLLDMAHVEGIRNAKEILDHTAEVLKKFCESSSFFEIPQPWNGLIRSAIYQNLRNFGYHLSEDISSPMIDSLGREISEIKISVNAKGIYDISVNIDGMRHRKFIKPHTSDYSHLSDLDILNSPISTKLKVIEDIFPKKCL